MKQRLTFFWLVCVLIVALFWRVTVERVVADWDRSATTKAVGLLALLIAGIALWVHETPITVHVEMPQPTRVSTGAPPYVYPWP